MKRVIILTDDKRSAEDFLGRWNKKDAVIIEKIIEEGCKIKR